MCTPSLFDGVVYTRCGVIIRARPGARAQLRTPRHAIAKTRCVKNSPTVRVCAGIERTPAPSTHLFQPHSPAQVGAVARVQQAWDEPPHGAAHGSETRHASRRVSR